jgi:multidrug efflux pump subunit AcrA (membrane-fusion protein)
LDNPDGHLLSDMYCTIVVTIGDGTNAIIVPAEAVVRNGGDTFVFVQTGSEGSKPKLRRAQVKIEAMDVGFGASNTASAALGSAAPSSGEQGESSGSVRVTEGIQSGDLIVTRGALGLYTEMRDQQNDTQ